jgi:hypothetical protein
VAVTIHSHSEYGAAATGDDGRFTLPVEGGGFLTFVFKKDVYITSHTETESDRPPLSRAKSFMYQGCTVHSDSNGNVEIDIEDGSDVLGARLCRLRVMMDRRLVKFAPSENSIPAIPESPS